MNLDGRGSTRIGAMVHRRLGSRYTDFWACVHDIAYPDVCTECEIARCDREIAEAMTQTDVPAWLVTRGVEDWEAEKRLLLSQAACTRVQSEGA